MSDDKQKQFIESVAPYAIETMRSSGVPASVTIAQAALESGWGEHAPGHNYFGIKGRGMAARALRKMIEAGTYRQGITPIPPGLQVFLTREWQDGRFVRMYDVFAAYADPREAFDAHAELFVRVPCYKVAFQAPDGPSFAKAIAPAYATDPGYADKLVALIAKYRLQQYDDLARLP